MIQIFKKTMTEFNVTVHYDVWENHTVQLWPLKIERIKVFVNVLYLILQHELNIISTKIIILSSVSVALNFALCNNKTTNLSLTVIMVKIFIDRTL